MLDDASAQLPVDPKRSEVIARTDTAGCSHTFTEACRERNVRFVVGHKLSADVAAVVTNVPKNRWHRAISADGVEEREFGEVTEITDVVDLARSEDTRMIVRRELPHPGAQLSFSDVDGYRYLVFITDHQEDDVCFLDALYRGRGRCERRICDTKDTGLTNLPSANFAINAAWLALVLIAGDLLVWMKGLCSKAVGPGRPSDCATRSCTPPACCALGAAHHLAHRRGLALGRRPRGRLHSTAELVQRLGRNFHRSCAEGHAVDRTRPSIGRRPPPTCLNTSTSRHRATPTATMASQTTTLVVERQMDYSTVLTERSGLRVRPLNTASRPSRQPTISRSRTPLHLCRSRPGSG